VVGGVILWEVADEEVVVGCEWVCQMVVVMQSWLPALGWGRGQLLAAAAGCLQQVMVREV
jgi:hypothetical protein